ncbi:cyclic nucleotide-gated channel rod photoreceptor subunit alpha-like isoform X2 [Ptychodera flava]|uniref:cyclic nucleotide-gated channel rod photoreceptor subunit alpha-like isoform X2 n=1 Tax=Ptychodera flava TaxID=63121 RepID=UPI003969DCBF
MRVNSMDKNDDKRTDSKSSAENVVSTENEDSNDINTEEDANVDKKRWLDITDFVINPEGEFLFYWMGLVTVAVGYNLWMIILRIAYREMREDTLYRRLFSTADFICDVIYILDIFFNFRIAYLEDGILVRDPVKLSANYKKKSSLKTDVLAMLPLGTIVQVFGGATDMICSSSWDFSTDSAFIPILRLPRLLKWYTMSTFFQITDSRTSNPNRLRALKLSLYLAVVIHWIACFYYMMSEAEGFGTNEWVYPNSTEDQNFLSKYVRSLYWSTVTLTTIGGMPGPVTNIEYIFTGITFLIGVFLFAAVVGNVGDVISNMNAARQEFQSKMDAIKFYMNHREVPDTLQNRVKKWSDYAWNRTQALDDQHFLEMLPHRLRAEIAIHVHLDILRKVKVKIFEDCERGLLCELVLKLRSQIYSPGDYICRTGEIGREMYIINHGKVQVVVPDPVTGQKMVVATLSEGNYFGEISLLKLDEGQNRRNADVVSLGYSELLCLSKKDLMQALVEYPDAKSVLEKHGRDRMEKNKEAARIQRRKSEALLQIPGMEKSGDDSTKDSNQQETSQTKTEGHPPIARTSIHDKGKEIGKEMSELRHVIHELRTFDSQSTKYRVQDLSEKCDELTALLHERDAELRRALIRISELEQRVDGKLKNGKVRSRFDLDLDSLDDSGYRRRNADASSDENRHWTYSVRRSHRKLGRQKRTEHLNGNSQSHAESNGSARMTSQGNSAHVPSLVVEKCGDKQTNVQVRDTVVPGISINGILHQEPAPFQFEVTDTEYDDIDGLTDSSLQQAPNLLLPVDQESAGDVSDFGSSYLSDASYESDY